MAPSTAAVRLLAGDKEPVRLATTANITLAGLLTIDGVLTETGDRVLVKNQTDKTTNGIYTASTGIWRRAPDANRQDLLVAGMKVHIQDGITLKGNIWSVLTDRPNIGTDDIEFGFYLSTTTIAEINAAAEMFIAIADDILAAAYAASHAADYPSRAVASALTIPDALTFVRTAGYNAAGDGGDWLYKKSVTIPDHKGYFQDAAGKIFVGVGPFVTERQFGVLRNNVDIEVDKCQDLLDYLDAIGGGVWLQGKGVDGVEEKILIGMDGADNGSLAIGNNTTIDRVGNVRFASKNEARGVNGYPDAVLRNKNRVEGNYNITLRGIKIGADTQDDQGGVFYAFKKVKKLRVIDCEGLHTRGSTRGQCAYCEDVRIEGFKTRYTDGWTKDTLPMQAGNNTAFEDGWRVGSGCKDVWVLNCDMETGDDSVTCSNERAETDGGDGDDISNVHIIGNRLKSRGGHSVRVFHAPDYLDDDDNIIVPKMTAGTIRNVWVEENHFEPYNTIDGVGIADYSDRRAIEAVFVRRNRIDLGQVVGNGITVLNTTGVEIEDNIIHNYGKYGIAANDSVGIKINRNTVRAGRTAGFDAIIVGDASSGYEITKNNIFNSTQHGIHVVDSNDGLVDGNQVQDPIGLGIKYSGTTTAHRCHHNWIKGGSTFAIGESASCSSGTITENDLRQAFGATLSKIDYANRSVSTAYEGNKGDQGFGPAITISLGSHTQTATGRKTTYYIYGSGLTSISTGAVQLTGAATAGAPITVGAFDPLTIISSGSAPNCVPYYH